MKYIDVSEWQGNVDWEKAKESIDGAILRAGYGKTGVDKQFARNASECNRLGIPCGAYWFSYAKSVEEAKAEALALIAAVKPYRMELPLAFDFEYDSVKNAEKSGVMITKELASEMVWAFATTIENHGYWCLNYANPDYLNRYFDEQTTARFGLWLASWPTAKVFDLEKPPVKCSIWQYSCTGSIPGITGNVDLDESYLDFRKIITEQGLNNTKPVYEDEDGSPIYEYTQQTQKPVDPADDAYKWAKSYGLITEDTPNCKEIALMLWRYHFVFRKEEDPKWLSGSLD